MDEWLQPELTVWEWMNRLCICVPCQACGKMLVRSKAGDVLFWSHIQPPTMCKNPVVAEWVETW